MEDILSLGNMSRAKKLKLNTIIGLFSQIVTFICGFIVPRIVLNYYGSEVNGLVSSIINFLSFISLAECGIGVVVQSSLYKPLAEKNNDEISRIIISSDRFFRKIGILLGGYVVVLLIIYPNIISTGYSYWYVCSLILVISISTFIQHYVCMSYRLLVSADQVGYIQQLLQILTQALIAMISIFIARAGFSIQIFKLSSSLILFLQPIILTIYIKKHYKINKKLELLEEPIKQKWNGLAQHIAYVILNNTDTVVLSLLSTLTNVSIYNIYYLVVNGIKTLITSVVSGMQSLLGNMYANGETDTLIKTFSIYESIIHIFVTFLYGTTCFLIVPFVMVYTSGITDADYNVPLFGCLISLAQMAYCIRLPYNAMVFAAGHYKQTQMSAIIEAIINVTLSVILVLKWGLIGVSIGTFVAMTYRTVYLATYLSKNILNRKISYFLKHIAVDVLTLIISYLLLSRFSICANDYLQWIIIALKVSAVIGCISIIVNIIFYPKEMRAVFNKLKQKIVWKIN